MGEVTSDDFARRRRHVARAILRRMVAHIAAGGTTDFARAAMENDPAVYTDAARAEIERRELFFKLPLLAGLSRDIPDAGDMFLFEELGQSIIVLRGSDGVARAFLNMCAHRGSKLVHANQDGMCSRRMRLTCPFHAWSYGLDGKVIAIPGRDGFEGVDLNRRNLIAVGVTEWHGMIFVRLQPMGAVPDIETYLGAFAPELTQLELAQAVPVQSSMLTAQTNWKLALDTYCEGYHFSTLHASTIGTTHWSNVAVFDAFGPHWRINFPGKDIGALLGVPESEWPESAYEGVHFIFPNTVLVVGAAERGRSFVRIFRLFPGSTPGTMTCHIAVYVLGAPGSEPVPKDAFACKDAESDVTKEDYRVAVDAYANLLNVPDGFKVVYGRNEVALQAVHRSIAEAIGGLPRP